MHWEILIVPLIALLVWILGTLFKGEDDPAKRGVRRSVGNRPGGPSRRPVTDLDRFLEEARRRREMEERRKNAPAPSPRPAATRPPLRERPAPPRPAPSRPAAPRQDILDAIPVPRPAPSPTPAVREVVLETSPVVPLPQPVAEAPSPPPPPAIIKPREARPSPILQQVRALLSKPQTAGAALVLREILDRPRCMRMRR